MRSVSYDVFQAPPTVTVVSPGSQLQYGYEYAQSTRGGLSYQSRGYTVDDSGAAILRRDQNPPSYRPNEIEEKYTARTESPTRGRTLERSIRVVRSSQSPARAPSPHPRGILRSNGSDAGRRKAERRGERVSRLTDASTAGVAGSTTALTTTTKASRSSSTSSFSDTAFSRRSLSSETSPSSQPYARSDYSSYARTSSHRGVFHFAYGAYLSPSQLRSCLRHNTSSSQPIALARLCNFTWYINARGVANIASSPPIEAKPAYTDADVVWGLLYNLDSDDESEVDSLHGWDAFSTGGRNYAAHEIKGRPWHQGDTNRNNKMFLMVEAVEWFVDPRDFGLSSEIWNGDKVRATVYVDEVNTKPGRIRNEFISCMSEAIATGISYGIPRSWTENVMRVYGIDPRKHQRNNSRVEQSSTERRQRTSRRQTSPYRSVRGAKARRARASVDMVEEMTETGSRTSDDTNERFTVVRKRRSREFY